MDELTTDSEMIVSSHACLPKTHLLSRFAIMIVANRNGDYHKKRGYSLDL
jgi:hypothetical protein